MNRRALPAVTALALLAGCASASGRHPPASPSEPPAELSAERLYERGLEAGRTGDSTRAEQYLAAALERGYPAEQAFPELLGTCIAADRFDVALHYARARLLHRPQAWALRYLVASLHLATGQDAPALVEIERLIAERPERGEPHYLHGVVARDHLRDPRRAQRAFQRYLQLAPRGPHAAEARAFLRRGGALP